MCGRFAIATPIHELADIMGCEPLSDLTPFEASWNVAPQTSVPVGTEVGVHGEINVPRHFRLMQWGFRPSWSKASNREPIKLKRNHARKADVPQCRKTPQGLCSG